MLGIIIGILSEMCVQILAPKVASKFGLDTFTCAGIGILLALIMITAGFYFATLLGMFH